MGFGRSAVGGEWGVGVGAVAGTGVGVDEGGRQARDGVDEGVFGLPYRAGSSGR